MAPKAGILLECCQTRHRRSPLAGPFAPPAVICIQIVTVFAHFISLGMCMHASAASQHTSVPAGHWGLELVFPATQNQCTLIFRKTSLESTWYSLQCRLAST